MPASPKSDKKDNNKASKIGIAAILGVFLLIIVSVCIVAILDSTED